MSRGEDVHLREHVLLVRAIARVESTDDQVAGVIGERALLHLDGHGDLRRRRARKAAREQLAVESLHLVGDVLPAAFERDLDVAERDGTAVVEHADPLRDILSVSRAELEDRLLPGLAVLHDGGAAATGDTVSLIRTAQLPDT